MLLNNIVELQDFPRQTPTYREMTLLLAEFHSVGFSYPIIHGGALRDLYRGRAEEIRDFDMLGNIPDFIDLTQSDQAILDQIQMALQSSALFSSAEKIDFMTHKGEGPVFRNADTGYIGLSVQIMLDGREINIYLGNQYHDTQTPNKMWSDSPINTIALDHTGRLYAHKNFERDAQNNEFNPYFKTVQNLSNAFSMEAEFFYPRAEKMSQKGLITSGFTMDDCSVQPLRFF